MLSDKYMFIHWKLPPSAILPRAIETNSQKLFQVYDRYEETILLLFPFF